MSKPVIISEIFIDDVRIAGMTSERAYSFDELIGQNVENIRKRVINNKVLTELPADYDVAYIVKHIDHHKFSDVNNFLNPPKTWK